MIARIVWKKEIGMSQNLNLILTVVISALQIIGVPELINDKQTLRWVLAAVMVINSIKSILASQSMPDGTPVKQAIDSARAAGVAEGKAGETGVKP